MPTIATIGVYEFDAASFIRALDAAGVTKVIDIRQRRGVRGSEYAWANARRLQALLADARIGYEYHPELAPDTELRHLQYREDARQGVGKRSRERLAPEYIRAYTRRYSMSRHSSRSSASCPSTGSARCCAWRPRPRRVTAHSWPCAWPTASASRWSTWSRPSPARATFADRLRVQVRALGQSAVRGGPSNDIPCRSKIAATASRSGVASLVAGPSSS